MTRRHLFMVLAAAAAAVMSAVPPMARSLSAQGSGGAAISVLATNAIVGPLTEIAEEQKRRGVQLNVEFDTSPSINRRFAAGTLTGVHVLVGASGTVDQAIKDGKAIADSRVRVGRVGVGVAIRRGATRPDISSVDALKAALLKADAVVYSQGSSGVYVAQMLEKQGLMAQLKSRAVQLPTGADMVERVRSSRGNEIGMTQISEIVRAVEETSGGIVFVGPLPAAVQYYTTFDAVAMTGASDAARAFVKSLVGPPARKLLAANQWEF